VSAVPDVATPRLVFGRAYSRFVSLTKWLLPGFAVVLLLLIAAWPRVQRLLWDVRMAVPRLDLSEARQLRMLKAHYDGIDRRGRPYVVTAEVARQSPKTDDIISLDGPKADLTTASGGWIELQATTGIYQPSSQLLDLFGQVDLYQDRGNEFHSTSAHIDIADGVAEGHQPIAGQGPFGNVEAQGFRILDHGATVIFSGHTTLELTPHKKGEP
jgi:lipopolysaccharide export system protein LptC